MAKIKFLSKEVNLSGNFPAVGSKAPGFSLTNDKLTEVTLSDFSGKRKVLSIVPSLDTPVCAASSRIFNQKASGLDNTVVLLISADLPFAQDRFCQDEGLDDVIALSTFRSDFADDYGVKIADGILAGLTARAVIIINQDDQIIYTQLVEELTHEPDYESALAVL